MGKQAIKAEQKGKSVIYYYNDGTTEVRSGDNIAVKTNNPGNISAYSMEGKKYGIGVYKRDSDNIFAIFPDVETGEKALREYLLRRYKDKTIEEKIYIYAPPKYNYRSIY